MVYQYQEYPKYLYHPKHAPEGKIFQSAEETTGLERKGWVDTPAKFPAKSKLELLFERIGQFLRSIGRRTISAWKWSITTISFYGFYIFMTLCIMGSFLLLYYLNKLEIFPATLFSVVAIGFSYHAYRFSKEKFRLDLFEKRFEIYEKTLEFCSTVAKYSTIPRLNDNNREEVIQTLQAAHSSFRGIGWHKTRALFGGEIHEVFQKLNKSYIFFIVFSDSSNIEDYQKWADDMHQHLTFICDIADKLPDLFSPYIYFGDYKK